MEQHRPLFFSKQEWWLHLLMIPVALPVGAYYFMGPRYFHDPRVLATGSLVNLAIYWLTIVLFTRAVRWAIHQFPNVQQAVSRMLVMLLSVGVIIAITAPFDVWLFSIIPGTGVRFSWEAVRPLWLLGCVLGPVFCLFIGMFYTYTQWHEHQTGNEQLKREALQHQFDALKGQLNPHFLFNSLNSLSSLIADEPQQDEQFVAEMAKVYRYLLQTNSGRTRTPDYRPSGDYDAGALTTLATELDFIRSYFHLLKTRYRTGIELQIAVPDACLPYRLPPLTLQMLIENAVKHNVIMPGKPLLLAIKMLPGSPDLRLLVRNNLQPKANRPGEAHVQSNQIGLANIAAKYRLLGQPDPVIQRANGCFRVIIPLFPPYSTVR